MPRSTDVANPLNLFTRVIRRRDEGDAAADRADRQGSTLAYYASKLPDKETWYQTDEGYRIYKNVPISRTGCQEYMGREIKKNRGYRPEWDIKDDDLITVYRPHAEVTDPSAIASFEGKSVLDEHPPDKVLIDALDELEGISQGHAHNVRVGETLASGETSLVADLWVKNPELNVKVDGGVRDVSCGYTFILDKDSAGQYIQKKIRGNHVAIVPRGRAGSEVGIQDAFPHQHPTRRITMSKPTVPSSGRIRSLFTALGFQSWAADAKPEEVADALEEMKNEDKKGGKDKKGAKDAEEHPKGCMCADCKEDRAAGDADEDDEDKDKKGKKDKDAADDDLEDIDKDEPATKDKKGAKDKGAKDEAEILPADQRSESDFKVGDAAASLRAMRPAIARSKDPVVRENYNKMVQSVRAAQNGVKDGAVDPFAALASIGEGVADAEPELPAYVFFNGKSYAEGLKAHNDYLEGRRSRRQS